MWKGGTAVPLLFRQERQHVDNYRVWKWVYREILDIGSDKL